MKIIGFDTETTGKPHKDTRYMASAMNTHLWPHMVQLAYVISDTDTNTIVKRVNKIIKVPEDVEITEESIQIHGITHEQCDKEGVDAEDALLELFEDCKDVQQFVAHNIQFDYGVIKAACFRILLQNNKSFASAYTGFEQQIRKTRQRCTMRENIELCKLVRHWDNGDQYHKFPTLGELHEHLFGTTPEDLHDALVDIMVCMKCFHKVEAHVPLVEKYDNEIKTVACSG